MVPLHTEHTRDSQILGVLPNPTVEPPTDPTARAQETRGRWNSTDNVMQLGWSGSAVLGGFLLDRYSFDGTFLITASVQVRNCRDTPKVAFLGTEGPACCFSN